MNNSYSKSFSEYKTENRGRIISLLLLFSLSMYLFYSMGIPGLAIVCMLPLVPIAIYLTLRYKLFTFGALFVLNYIIMGIGRYVNIPLPITAISQPMVFLLLFSELINLNERNGKYLANAMYFMFSIWVGYLVLEILNNTCDLPFNFGSWFLNTYLLGLQIIFGAMVVSLVINNPQKLFFFLKIWAIMSIIATIWAFRQKTFGFDNAENGWLMGGGRTTHIIGGTIRYFSFFSDAANFGCHMAAAAIAFFIVGATSKIKKHKLLFFITGACCTYSMFSSGTRTAIFCFLAGTCLYIILSKSIKLGAIVTVLVASFTFLLAFTTIGQSNSMIRRMRSAFDKDDASSNVRDINKQALEKYMQDAPWGLGISVDPEAIPSNNKYKIVTQTASDSTYVYLWEYTGIIGEYLFALVNIATLFGGCYIVLFRIKNKSLQGIGAAFCCSFAAINVGGYANNILTQYPNIIVLFGSMALTYSLPLFEDDYNRFEETLIAEQEEKKRIKLEKKRASRL